MGQGLWIAGVVIWVAWSVQAVLSVLQVRKFARRLEREPRRAFARYRPAAAVIVPFKGCEVDLQANLNSLFEQDYPDYQLVLVVESEKDPAYGALREAMEGHPQRRAQIVLAGEAPADEGQKVHNQRVALAELEKQQGGEAVWVFADSDAVPGPQWLAELVGPLGQGDKTGVTTGYRWLVPRRAEGRWLCWSSLASVLNSSVACFYGRDEYNHAWGGSMAMRVQTARQGQLLERLKGALSDDYQVSAMCQDLGLRIYFVPRCLVAGPVALSFAELLNFGYRQHVITRIHAPKVFIAGLAFHALYVLGLVSAWAGLAAALIVWPTWWAWMMPAGAMVAVALANQVRSSYRRLALRRALGPQVPDTLRQAMGLDRWATWLWMSLHALLLARAALGRTIRWRGIRYRLHGPQRIERLD